MAPANVTSHRKKQTFERREAAILSCALQCCSGDDWQSVTVSDIASEAGIAKGSIYLHFGSKDEIYARIALDFYTELLDQLETCTARDHKDHLRSVIHTAFDFHLQRPQYRRVTLYCGRDDFRQSLPKPYAEEFEQLDKRFNTMVCGMLENGKQAGAFDQQPTEQQLLGLRCTFHGAIALLWGDCSTSTASRPEFVHQIAEYMLNSIASGWTSSVPAGAACEEPAAQTDSARRSQRDQTPTPLDIQTEASS